MEAVRWLAQRITCLKYAYSVRIPPLTHFTIEHANFSVNRKCEQIVYSGNIPVLVNPLPVPGDNGQV
jgi:hypothetical protein